MLSLAMYACGNSRVEVGSSTTQQTPKGATISTDIPLSPSQLSVIDSGLDKAFEDAKKSGYDEPKIFAQNFYHISIPKEPCILTSGVYAFQVENLSYDGSVYDKHNTFGELPSNEQDGFNKFVKDGKGVITTPEQTMNKSNGEFAVCPNLEGLELATKYAAEHIIIYNVDSDYYEKTAVHTVYAHPLLPKH